MGRSARRTEAPPSTAGAPWLRLTGALLVGLAVVDLAFDSAVPWLLGRMIDPEHHLFADSEFRRALEKLAEDARVGVGLMEAFAVATLLVLFLLRAGGRIRIAAALAGAAALFGAAPLVSVMMYTASSEIVDGPTLAAWLDYGGVAQLAGAVAMAAIVYLHAPRGRRVREASIAAMAIGLAATACLSLFQLSDAHRWWEEMLGPVHLSSFIVLLAGLGKGLGLWLAAAPTEHHDLDAAAARGLRLARVAVWLRVLGAVAAASMLIAGSISLQKSAAAALRSRSSIRDLPLAFEAAPWLGYLETALGALVVVALAAALIQRRSTLTTVLVTPGVLLLMIAVAGSFGLSAALHDTVREIGARGFGLGGTLQRFTDLSELVTPMLRGAGILGTASVLVGLAMLARRTGHPTSHRLIRFMALCVVMTLIWLFRDPIDDLGDAAYLFIPVLLVAIVWALVELGRYLGDVADGLDGKGARTPATGDTPP